MNCQVMLTGLYQNGEWTVDSSPWLQHKRGRYLSFLPWRHSSYNAPPFKRQVYETDILAHNTECSMVTLVWNNFHWLQYSPTYWCRLLLLFMLILLINLCGRKLSQIRVAADRSGHTATKLVSQVVIMRFIGRASSNTLCNTTCTLWTIKKGGSTFVIITLENLDGF